MMTQTQSPDIRIPPKRLEHFARELLLAGGFTKDEAAAVAASLTQSEIVGHASHGLMRVKEYLHHLEVGATVSQAKPETIRETPNSLAVNMHGLVGQVAMPDVLKRVYAKMETQAVVSAALRNCGHIGRLGEWVEGPAYAGYPALLFVNDNGKFFLVAPPGGKKPVTSTNPFAFAIPLSKGEIFMSDMSTSSIAFGKAKVARLAGVALPPGCIQDAEGRPSTDPQVLFDDPPGSLLPMGGLQNYKGFALSMFIDMLVAGLSGGETPPAPPGVEGTNNIVLLLWNPQYFSGLEHMQREAEKYIAYIRASPPIDPEKPIRISGDRTNAIREENKRGIPLSEGLVQALVKLAKKLNITPPEELVVSR